MDPVTLLVVAAGGAWLVRRRRPAAEPATPAEPQPIEPGEARPAAEPAGQVGVGPRPVTFRVAELVARELRPVATVAGALVAAPVAAKVTSATAPAPVPYYRPPRLPDSTVKGADLP